MIAVETVGMEADLDLGHVGEVLLEDPTEVGDAPVFVEFGPGRLDPLGCGQPEPLDVKDASVWVLNGGAGTVRDGRTEVDE